MMCTAKAPASWGIKGTWACILDAHGKEIEHQFREQKGAAK